MVNSEGQTQDRRMHPSSECSHMAPFRALYTALNRALSRPLSWTASLDVKPARVLLLLSIILMILFVLTPVLTEQVDIGAGELTCGLWDFLLTPKSRNVVGNTFCSKCPPEKLVGPGPHGATDRALLGPGPGPKIRV